MAMSLSDLLDGLRKPAQEYMLRQCEDAGLFVLHAVTQGYDAGSTKKALKLAKAAAKWVIEHGTPTPEDVKAALGL
jgi:hypothetical protein